VKLADELIDQLPPPVSAKFEAGGRFYESDAVIATYRVLHLIAAYPNDTALLLALETPYLRGIDAEEKVHWLLEHGAIDRLPLTGYVNTAHKEVFDRVNELRMAARIATVPQLLASLYEKFRIREYYRGRGDLQSIENLEQLREMARELFNNEQALTLRDFVDFLRTMILTDTAQDEAPLPNQGQGPENVVRLMTVHRSKGLEFPFVLIPDCSSELISDRKSPWLVVDDTGPGLDLRVNGLRTESNAFAAFEQRMRQTQVEEEMRILYVAVTRAQHSVVFFARDIRAPKDPGRPYYSWADEITRAEPHVLGMVRI
jgi:ATP-dependent exoDNAse (exonuclease V) beta subunit